MEVHVNLLYLTWCHLYCVIMYIHPVRLTRPLWVLKQHSLFPVLLYRSLIRRYLWRLSTFIAVLKYMNVICVYHHHIDSTAHLCVLASSRNLFHSSSPVPYSASLSTSSLQRILGQPLFPLSNDCASINIKGKRGKVKWQKCFKKREECDTYLTHVCWHRCSGEHPVKR